jgi:hypothetical protein
VAFIGQKGFVGVDEALSYVSPPTQAQHEARRRLEGAIKRGLIRYVNRTPLAQDIQVTYEPSTLYAPEASDPWNHWIFSTSVRALLTGEEAVWLVPLAGTMSATLESKTFASCVVDVIEIVRTDSVMACAVSA